MPMVLLPTVAEQCGYIRETVMQKKKYRKNSIESI
jgi:hypothetical protein